MLASETSLRRHIVNQLQFQLSQISAPQRALDVSSHIIKILSIIAFIFTVPGIHSCNTPTGKKNLEASKANNGIVKAQDFLFTKVALKDIDSIESLKYSKRYTYDYSIGVSMDYFPNRKLFRLSQPIVYRKNLEGYFLETSYYFSLPDSNLRLVEYWWRDTTNNSYFVDTLTKRNRRTMSSYFHNSGTQYPENETEGERTIWEDSIIYVKQFPVADGVRILISWK